MCLKVLYSSKAEAAAVKMFKRGRQITMRQYYCYQCDGWHNATKKRHTLRKHKHAKYHLKFFN